MALSLRLRRLVLPGLTSSGGFENCDIDAIVAKFGGVEYNDTIDPEYDGEPYDIRLIEVSARFRATLEE